MMRLTKRVISAFLAFVMVFTMLPLDAWAADGDDVSGNSLIAPMSVIPEDENHYITYIFKNGENVVSTQILTNGDTLQQPATPDAPEGQRFTGWKTEDGDTPNFGEVSGVTEDQTITYKADFKDVIYVTFLSQDGSTVLAVKEVDSGTTVNDNGVTFLPSSGTMFQHWSETKDGEEEFDFDTPITEDTTLYAVCAQGYWIVFDSDGGTHVDTQYVAQGGTAVLPTPPHQDRL